MKLIKEFFPIVYSFKTRIVSKSTKISYLYNYIIPNLLLIYLFDSLILRQEIWLVLCLLISSILNYEIGYIWNDAYTVEFEENPTIRLSKDLNNKLKRQFIKMVYNRILIITLLICYAYYFRNIKNYNLDYFLLCLVLTQVVYSYHNYYRGRENIVTMFFLMLLKYISIPLFFLKDFNDIKVLLLFILTLPFVRTLLYTTHERCKITLINRNFKDFFRVKYFTMLSIISYLGHYIFSDLKYLFLFSNYFLIFFALGLIRKKRGEL